MGVSKNVWFGKGWKFAAPYNVLVDPFTLQQTQVTAVRGSGRRPGCSAWAQAPVPRFLARRLGALLLVVWVVEIATFLMVRVMPGDPARQVLGPHASAQAVAALRHQLGLDQPLLSQYVHYTAHVLRLDFGTSFYTHLPVSTELELAGRRRARADRAGRRDHPRARDRRRADRRRAHRTTAATRSSSGCSCLFTGVLGSVPGYVMATVLALAVRGHLEAVPGRRQLAGRRRRAAGAVDRAAAVGAARADRARRDARRPRAELRAQRSQQAARARSRSTAATCCPTC